MQTQIQSCSGLCKLRYYFQGYYGKNQNKKLRNKYFLKQCRKKPINNSHFKCFNTVFIKKTLHQSQVGLLSSWLLYSMRQCFMLSKR